MRISSSWRRTEALRTQRRKRKEKILAFKRKTEKDAPCQAFCVPQTYPKSHPYDALSDPETVGKADIRLYSTLRDAIPVIDAAISKLVRLLGTFEVVCADKKAQKALSDFLKNVPVGTFSSGINAFVSCYFDYLLTYGTAVGEIVLDRNGEICALYPASLENVELTHGRSPLEYAVRTVTAKGSFPVKYPELVLVSAINPEPNSVYGRSVLKGLPFVSDVLLKIYNTIGVNWERIGNVRYAVTYRPQNDPGDRAYAKQRAEQVALQWGKTMQPSGPVKDFVAVGDVNIKVIGADNQILDSNIPVRQMLEQIVAKLGIPPFLLGLNWSSTERMSSQQADVLTSELEYYRETLNPVLRKICSLFLRMNGYGCDFEIIWNDITLQDELQIAQAEYYNAQTQKLNNESAGENIE